MQSFNSPPCPSCGKPLQPADFFDQQAGFTHADCVCGYCTKPAAEGQLCAVGAQALLPTSMTKDFAAGQAIWLEVQAKVSKFDFSESAGSLCESAALLMRIAAADASPEARTVERWLGNMGLVGGLTRLAARTVADWQAGEGPRSGGGAATSGAGAQRKEGVQPPGDSASAMGAIA